jgi:hypothetical protein
MGGIFKYPGWWGLNLVYTDPGGLTFAPRIKIHDPNGLQLYIFYWAR